MNIFPEAELVKGLKNGSKYIPCDYYYDDYGSKLFDVLCMQEDYYLFRSEIKILQNQGEKILALNSPDIIVDLGCGTCEKTIELIKHLASKKGNGHQAQEVVLIDVNKFILEFAAAQIKAQFPTITVTQLNLSYAEALEAVAKIPGKKAILFLGGNIGNMVDGQILEFMRTINNIMGDDDTFVLGVDRDKDPKILEKAYNDRNGIAKLTNLNVLNHINTLYDGNFDESSFQHIAVHYPKEFTVKSHLVSMREQSVELKGLDMKIDFALGESVLTEIERKFDLPQLYELFGQSGFSHVKSFPDPNEWYGVEVFSKSINK